jgi:hypothetical protein
VSKTYQNSKIDTPDALELAVPEHVSVVMAEVAGDVREGLLALAVGTGLQVMTALMEADVTALAGPKGKHDSERRAVRHGQLPVPAVGDRLPGRHAQAYQALPAADQRQGRTVPPHLGIEWAYVRAYSSDAARVAALRKWLHLYTITAPPPRWGATPSASRVTNLSGQ